MNKKSSHKIGQTAALGAAVSTLIFGLSLVWEMFDLSGFAKNLGNISSIFIALSVVTMMAAFYDLTREKYRIFGLLALLAAVLYAPLCIGTYYLQLSSVLSNPLELSGEVLKAITFKPGSPIFAVDMLGYSFLCLSTLAAGFALPEAKDRILRALSLFHGALVIPTAASPILSGLFLTASGETDFTGHYVLLFWCAVFVPIALLFKNYFRAESNS